MRVINFYKTTKKVFLSGALFVLLAPILFLPFSTQAAGNNWIPEKNVIWHFTDVQADSIFAYNGDNNTILASYKRSTTETDTLVFKSAPVLLGPLGSGQTAQCGAQLGSVDNDPNVYCFQADAYDDSGRPKDNENLVIKYHQDTGETTIEIYSIQSVGPLGVSGSKYQQEGTFANISIIQLSALDTYISTHPKESVTFSANPDIFGTITFPQDIKNDKEQLFKTDVTGIGLTGPGIDNLPGDIVENSSPKKINFHFNAGPYKNNFIANSQYTIKLSSSRNVVCTTMKPDPNELKGVLTNYCALTYTAELGFYLDQSGRITSVVQKDSISRTNATFTDSSGNKGRVIPPPDGANWLQLNGLEVTNSPLDEAISNAIKWVTGFVQQAMKFVMGSIDELLNMTEKYVLGTKAEVNAGKAPMMVPWISIRNVALGLLVMALVIIAFANVMQVDLEQYGLARMIPRIIISIIMAYGSWIIVTFFFDLSAAIQAQARGLTSTNMLTSLSSIAIKTPDSGQIIAHLGTLLAIIVILLGVIACGIVLMFTLLIRIVMLSFLLVVAPLAFILNIVPFTANMYKQWWSEFFKWMFMGPMAMAIIALGSVIASASTLGAKSANLFDVSTSASLTVFGGSEMNIFIGLIIFAAALYMAATLPMQWGGKIMSAWAGAGKKAAKNAWGATGAAAGKKAWEWTGAKDFMAGRRSNIANMARSKGEILRSKIAGDGGSRLRSFAAGHAVINKGMARAQAEVAHDSMIEGKIKNEGLDKLDDQELQTLQNGAAVGSAMEEAIFTTRMKNGWTSNGIGADGKIRKDQATFNRLATNNRSLVASARVAGKGRDLLLGSGNAAWVGHAINDASKEEVQRWGADETHNLTKFAERGLADSGLRTAMAGGQTMDQALETITDEYDDAIAGGAKLSDADTERYRDLRSLKLTRSIEGGKMKRGYEQGGSVKAGYFGDANQDIFNEGAKTEIAAQKSEAATGKRGGGSTGGGSNARNDQDNQQPPAGTRPSDGGFNAAGHHGEGEDD